MWNARSSSNIVQGLIYMGKKYILKNAKTN
jgi:hypothetical protein